MFFLKKKFFKKKFSQIFFQKIKKKIMFIVLFQIFLYEKCNHYEFAPLKVDFPPKIMQKYFVFLISDIRQKYPTFWVSDSDFSYLLSDPTRIRHFTIRRYPYPTFLVSAPSLVKTRWIRPLAFYNLNKPRKIFINVTCDNFSIFGQS